MSGLLDLFGVQAAQGMLSGLIDRQDAIKQNKLIAQQRIMQTQSAMRSMIDVQVSKDQNRQAAVTAESAARVAALSAAGTERAAAGASGVRGASVDAVQSDIQSQLGQAIDETKQSEIANEFNLNQQIVAIATQARSSLPAYNRIPSIGQTLIRGAIQGGMSAGSAYVSARFKYGV